MTSDHFIDGMLEFLGYALIVNGLLVAPVAAIACHFGWGSPCHPGGWVFLAAAPLLVLIGVALLRNPSRQRPQMPSSQPPAPKQGA